MTTAMCEHMFTRSLCLQASGSGPREREAGHPGPGKGPVWWRTAGKMAYSYT